MKVVRKGRINVTKSIVGGAMAQVLRGPIAASIRADCFVAAEKVRREAERIARNQIGANDRIVRGYKVRPASDGYFNVLNEARGNNGRALGQPWEQGTGIHYRKYEGQGAGKEIIRASRYGKKYFVWHVRANEQKRGVAFFDESVGVPGEPVGPSMSVSLGEGRVRRDTKGRIRKRRYQPGQLVFAEKIEGFPGTHALEKASRNMARIHKWRYNRNR